MNEFRRVKAALIGSGDISAAYLRNITAKHHVIDMVGCSDLIPERAQARAGEYGLRAMTNEEIYADPAIEIVINTTYPSSHVEVTRDALLAGKHVYSEKMMAVELQEGFDLLALSRERGLLYTVAPDTFLGGGWQTARRLIDDGYIGEPVTALGVCIRSYKNFSGADEPKHFCFLPGGGIPFDMGGYYLHALIHLLGPLRRVTGFMHAHAPTKPIAHPAHPRYGETYEAESPNTAVGALEFARGALGSLVITSESGGYSPPRIEVHGTQGSLALFDPNDYSGRIALKRSCMTEPADIPSLYPFNDENRGIGVADMAYALLNGRRPRADAALGLHAFEATHGIWESAREGRTHEMRSTCEQPKPLPLCDLGGDAWQAMLDD